MHDQHWQEFAGEYYFLPQEHVLFGADSVERLASEVERLGVHRALIITGQTLARQTGVVDRVAAALGPRHAGTVDNIRQHTPRSAVDAAVGEVRRLGADVLVSVGGGSPIDAAKAVARTLLESEGTMPAQIAIPTTLSAAEFSHRIGVTDEITRSKVGMEDPRTVPRTVILDATLTVPTPERLWISSGIRALDHAVETLYAPGTHPIESVLAREAIRDLFAYLPRSHRHPDDLDTRTRLQLAAWMSFFGEVNTPMGLSHNLGRRIGATYDVPHGITSCITLPHVMRFEATTHAAALAPIARMLGRATDETPDSVAALRAADAVAQLIAVLGLPGRLSEVGISAESIPAIATATVGDSPQRPRIEQLLREML